MEVIHHRVKIVKRSQGRSAVGAAAYRAGERLHNENDGITHDYTRRRGVVYREIFLPENAPAEFCDREKLWNAVEKIEKASNSQLARDVEFSLPNNLDRPTQIRLVREHVQAQFVERGMCADIAIHDKGDGNPHAHILLTMRPLNKSGKWGQKSKREYLLDRNGQRIPLSSGDFKTRKISLTDWDDKGNAEKWHEAWAEACNRTFERLGYDRRVTNASYLDQGILQEPTIHLGKTATQMERRGARSELGDMNREIRNNNDALTALRDEIKELERQEKIAQARQTEKFREPEPMITIQPKSTPQTLYTAPTVAQPGISPKHDLVRHDQLHAESERARPAEPTSQVKEPHVHRTQPVREQKATSPAPSLDDIKQEYISLEIDIRRQKRLASDLRDKIRRFDAKREDLTETVGAVRDFSDELSRLQQRREGLSPFAVAERRQLDASIEKLTLSREQAHKFLVTEHGVSDLRRLDEHFAEISRGQEDAQRDLAALPELKLFEQKQHELEESYRREFAKAGPESKKAEQRGREDSQAKKVSLPDHIAASEAEKRLQKLTEPEKDQNRDRDRNRGR